MNQVTAILIGAGARGQIYARYAQEHPEELRIIAVAEPKADRRALMCRAYGIPADRAFSNWEDLMARPQMADAALICTLDDMHTEPTLAALKQGYHVLLEKPMSNSETECRAIAAAAEEAQRVLSVCHVLRYTPFYRTIKQLIDDGQVGEVASLSQVENVGYWHHAHSFVRGNWRCSEQTSPMILQKSCHDMDILLWLSGQRCTRVSSFGSLHHFDAAHAPQDAPLRCTDGCPHSVVCPYDAGKIYLTDNVGWPTDMLTTDLSREGRLKALREGPYGRCVYHCDNDVVDRQVVNLEFDNGAVAGFTMTAFTTDMARQLKVCGTKGQITADMNANTVSLHRFGESGPREITLETPPQTNNYGHGGGLLSDARLCTCHTAAAMETLSSARVSLQSHLICLPQNSRVERRIVEL
ncbi:MAG: Gfo/Idh/MocA family protein [Ruthenibacterium lactatiformans]